MTGDALGAFKKEAHMAVADGVLSLLAGDIHCAIGTEAAVQTPEASFTPVFPVLVLPAAAHSVPVHYTRRNLHLEHFVPAPGAAQASSEMVLQGSVGARGTHPAVRVSPWTRTVIVQIGTFVALGAANGAILRVVIFSLGTGTLSLLQVPGVRDQPLNPCGVHICQQSWKHLGRSQMEEDPQERKDGDHRGSKSKAFSNLLPGTPPPTLRLSYRHCAVTIVLSFSHPLPSNPRLQDPRCGLYFILVSPNQLSGLDQGRCSVEGLRTGLSFQ